MSTEQPAERPTLVPQYELSEIAKSLPEGAVVLGGVKLSDEAATQAPDQVAARVSGPCVLVFSAADDHTIHRSEICGSGTHYEIISDTVVGHW
jgi:hypothetical protein